MDVLTLPEPAWALAYPSPRIDMARMMHIACGWLSDESCYPENIWQQQRVMGEHRCPLLVQRWCPNCSCLFQIESRHATPHMLCTRCAATNPDKRVRRRFFLSGRR